MASTSSRVFHQYSVAFAWILIAVFVSCASAQFSGPIGPPDQYDEPEPPIEGFHFKLSEDILVNATKRAVLNDYNILDLGKNNELSVVAVSSGLDKVSGIFRPSNGYYFLSTLVHVAVVAEEETAEDSTSNSEKEPRVTVSICINANCGNSAVLRSSSAIPSSGDLHTFSISGILKLERDQELTVRVKNHSNTRQLVIFKQSAFNTHLMKEG